MLRIKYRCAQPDLYVACRYGWRLCRRNLAAFAALKAKYTEAFIDEQLEAVEAADLLPDFNARYQEYDLTKRKYDLCLSVLISKYDHLLSYVDDAYPPDERTIMYRACGEPFFAKAKSGHWASVLALVSAAGPFLEKNKDTLESCWKTPSVKNNMPADFVAEFKTIQTELTTINDALQTSDEDGQGFTSEKIEANNAIYNAVMEMCLDAARVFNNAPDMKEEFTFTSILNKTRGVRPAGIKGKIIKLSDNKPLVGVTVGIKGSGKMTLTDKQGRYELTPIEAGKYFVTAELEGYQFFVSAELTVKTGKMTRLNADLEGVLVAV